MNEHPILFSRPMVRAILEGRKTQTRRVVKFKNTFFKGITGQVQEHHDMKTCYPMPNGGFVFWSFDPGKQFSDLAYENSGDGIRCPYGEPGDRLWVRETWSASPGCIAIKYQPDVLYRADTYPAIPHKWRPSIFMPRWASRIALEIVNVRVERVGDISTNDALAEGVEKTNSARDYWAYRDYTGNGQDLSPCMSYQSLWESINASRGFGWDVNPWVWILDFKRL